MNYYVDLQKISSDLMPLSDNELISVVRLSLQEYMSAAEITLRLVDLEEITNLNGKYRQQNKATNVLAFSATSPPDVKLLVPFLGDVVICPAVLQEESAALAKPLRDHWTHIIIHGILHLLGYDHIKKTDSKIMQQQEVNLLKKLGIGNPYSFSNSR